MGRKFGTRENKNNHNTCLKSKFWNEIEEKLKFMATYGNNNTHTNELQYSTVSENVSQSSSDTYIM